jgi:hypothetical protein
MSTFIENNLTLALLVPTVIAVVAVLFAGYLALAFHHLRRQQRTVLGDGQERDLIAHAHSMQSSVDGLGREIERLAGGLGETNKRLDECFTHRSVMRYDAYNDLSGMQSTTVALLDAHFSGILISSIQSRDHARIYVKEVRHGDSREKLSPEEEQVLKEAMGIKPRRLAGIPGGGSVD